ncbi:MAG TPA: signal peptidase I [Acidimicrobiales bacterium]
MSVHSTNGKKQSSVSIRPPDAGVDPVLSFDQGYVSPPPAGDARSRSRRRVDYRLRGLDLGVQKQHEGPIVPVRTDQSRRRHRRRLLIGWAVVVVVGSAVGLVLRLAVVEPFTVPSGAMAPALQAGDRILVVKTSVAGPIQRGNIIVFHHPEPDSCLTTANGGQDLVQRVVGMPGQTIGSSGDTIDVNGHALRDPGSPHSKLRLVGSKPIPLTTVPVGEYFVMGDNPSLSCDSRSFGAISASSVVGKVVSIVLRGGHPYIHIF